MILLYEKKQISSIVAPIMIRTLSKGSSSEHKAVKHQQHNKLFINSPSLSYIVVVQNLKTTMVAKHITCYVSFKIQVAFLA